MKTQHEAIYNARELGTGKTLVLGLQHMFAMFGATVLVPIITGLSISTTLLFAGLATLFMHFVTKNKVYSSALPLLSSAAMQQSRKRAWQPA